MSTFLQGLDTTNRLVEAVGSAALFQDVATAAPVAPLGGGLDLLGTAADADSSTSTTTQAQIDPLSLAGLPVDGALDGLDVANLGDVTGTLGSLPVLNGLGGTAQPTAEPLALLGSLTGTSGDGLLGTLDLANLGTTVGGVLGATGTDGSALPLVGQGAAAQPVAEPVNQLVLDVHQQLEILAHQVGLSAVVHGVTDLGETIGLGYIGVPGGPGGATNLVSDVANLPGNLLGGNLDGSLQNIGNDLTHVVNGVNNAVTYVLPGGDASNPIPELIEGVGHSLQTLPLVTVNGGNNAGDGGLLGGVVGDIGHSGSGHLIDLDLGPQQSGGLGINLLSSGDSNTHTVSVNAVDVGQNGPHLLDAGLLTGSGPTAPVESLLGSLTASGAPALPDVAHLVPSSLPLPAIGDLAGLGGGLGSGIGGHGLLDLHGAHII